MKKNIPVSPQYINYSSGLILDINKEVQELSIKLKAAESILFPNEEITPQIIKILRSINK